MRGPAKPARAAVSLAQPNRRVEKPSKANATMPIDRPVQTRAEKSPPQKKKEGRIRRPPIILPVERRGNEVGRWEAERGVKEQKNGLDFEAV